MRARDALLNLLYPPDVACIACNREALLGEDFLCDACRESLVRAPGDLPAPPPLSGLCAGLLYTAPAESAIHRFKYRRGVWLTDFLASYIVLSPDWQIDCLVPVPLHPLRQWKRGYNQSELLCRALNARYALPVRTDLIRRVRNTPQQARLSAAERAYNLDGAFKANTAARGLSILLVDDVTTTHETLVRCALSLTHAGASRVYAACACLAGQHDYAEQSAPASESPLYFR